MSKPTWHSNTLSKKVWFKADQSRRGPEKPLLPQHGFCPPRSWSCSSADTAPCVQGDEGQLSGVPMSHMTGPHLVFNSVTSLVIRLTFYVHLLWAKHCVKLWREGGGERRGRGTNSFEPLPSAKHGWSSSWASPSRTFTEALWDRYCWCVHLFHFSWKCWMREIKKAFGSYWIQGCESRFGPKAQVLSPYSTLLMPGDAEMGSPCAIPALEDLTRG